MMLFQSPGKKDQATSQEQQGQSPVKPAENKEQVEPVPPLSEDRPKATVIMTEQDSYLHELISAQPATVEEAVAHVISLAEDSGLHRLSLPEPFERLSYDCTRGHVCKHHSKDDKGKILNPGKFIFRWIMKDKRAIDDAKNVKGWSIASKLMAEFRDIPRTIFSVHGGVEIGDAVLAVMPVDRALKLRRFPGEISRERIRGQVTPSKKKAGKMIMSGNPDSENIYEPDTAGEESDADVAAPSHAFQEGRDF